MSKVFLRCVVLGAGGIGCYYGARLQAQGHDVTFIARGEHLKVLQTQGLDLRHPGFHFQQPVNAKSLEALTLHHQPSDVDMLVVCTKAIATEEVAQIVSRWFKKHQQETAVISLQNGIDNERQLAEILGEDVVIGGLAVRIGGHIISPGVVEATGVAQVIVGAWPKAGSPADERYGDELSQWCEVFNQAGIPTKKVDNIRHELWRKLVINNGVNPLSALTRLDTRAMSHHPHFGKIVHQLMKEAAQVAIADDEPLSEQDADEMYQLIRNFDPIKTSMLVDLEKGRPLEVDAISGAVIERSKRLGVHVPYTETIYALLKHQLSQSDAD